MSPSLALQTVIRARLISSATVLALVPASEIADRHGRPARFPSISFGEAREYPLGEVKRDSARIALDLHVWTDTPGTRDAKQIADAVRHALRNAPWRAEGHTVMDLRLTGTRIMADPGATDLTHGVVSFEALTVESIGEAAPSDDPAQGSSGQPDPYIPSLDYDPGDLTLLFDNKLI